MTAEAEKPADPANEPGPPDARPPTPAEAAELGVAADAPSVEPAPVAEVAPAATRPQSGSWGELLVDLQQHWPDITIVAALLALFVLVHRFVQYVEFGGDAVAKWQFVRQWWFHNDILHGKWDHHACRMGVNLITWVVQGLFGRSWRSYYIAPFFVAALQVPFVYLIGQRLVNRLAGIASALIIIYLETVHRSASQLLPDGYAGTYAIIGAYLLLRFAQAPDAKKRSWLIGVSAVAFAGYEAKETFVFFYPGFVIAIWFLRYQIRDILLFCGILLGGLLTETGLYAAFTNYSSRYAAIRGTHGANGDWPIVDLHELFLKRFAAMTDTWKYLMFFSLASALWLIALNPRRAKEGRSLALIGISHVFFLNFTVKSINPIELWQAFDPRYMDPYTPFGALFIGCLLAAVAEQAWNSAPKGVVLEKYGPQSSPALAAVWSLALLALPAWNTFTTQQAHPPPDAFELGARLASVANATYDRNLPLLDRHKVKAKDITALYDVYMSDKHLAKDGKLPNFDDVKRVDARRGMTYLVKNPSVYNRDVLEQLEAAGCVVWVTRNKHGYLLTPFEPLPQECDSVLAKAIQ